MCKRKDGTTVGIVNPAKVKIDRCVHIKADLNPYDDNWQRYLEQKNQMKMVKTKMKTNQEYRVVWKQLDVNTGTISICKYFSHQPAQSVSVAMQNANTNELLFWTNTDHAHT